MPDFNLIIFQEKYISKMFVFDFEDLNIYFTLQIINKLQKLK